MRFLHMTVALATLGFGAMVLAGVQWIGPRAVMANATLRSQHAVRVADNNDGTELQDSEQQEQQEEQQQQCGQNGCG